MLKSEADTIAKKEIEAIFGVTEEEINFSDPISALRKNLIFNKNFNPEFPDETKAYYQKAQQTLIKEIPMKTYRKHQYGTGVNVDLLKDNESPEHRDILTLNTPRILRHRLKLQFISKRFNFKKIVVEHEVRRQYEFFIILKMISGLRYKS